jgi:hypothetical protein
MEEKPPPLWGVEEAEAAAGGGGEEAEAAAEGGEEAEAAGGGGAGGGGEPEAEVCGSDKICVTPEELGSPEALSEWLADRLAQGREAVSRWGKLQGTKRVSNLWKELREGEISLQDSRPPKRTVHVACVEIVDSRGRSLLEAYQEMEDGSIRHRNRPLSEKMKPGEQVESACLRGIWEELGPELGAPHHVQIRRNSYRREEEERESLTYPGLMTHYVLHHMEALMEHLPAEDFFTEENEYGGYGDGDGAQNSGSLNVPIGVARHAWKWVPATSRIDQKP